MIVVFFFLFGLTYLLYAGYGFSGIFLRDHASSRFFILLNGYCLSIFLFSETYFLFHKPIYAFWFVIGVVTAINILFVLFRKARGSNERPVGARSVFRKKQRIVATASVYILATAVVVIVGWSFAHAGWNGFWGSANEDIFDGLNGRDVFVQGSGSELAHFLDPLVLYQYSGLAFWSFLFNSFDGMNVFLMQGLLMIFLQVLGTYYLCRRGFRFGHRISLFCTFLASTGSLYVSTYHTGHEGSIIFGAVVPYLLGSALQMVHERRLNARLLFLLLFWTFFIVRTYVFPLGFTVIPLTLYACYTFVPRHYFKNLWSRGELWIHSAQERFGHLEIRWILLVGILVAIVALTYFVSSEVWSMMEPIRQRAVTKYRSWSISHYKEMALIYWGILPASLPYGSIANPAMFSQSVFTNLGYLLALVYTALVVVGIFRLFKLKKSTGLFFAFQAACWLIFFLFMKFFVVDSYYLYKFLYTNFFLGAILLGFAIATLFVQAGLRGRALYRPATRMIVGIVASVYILSNLGWISLYNLDLLQRPYNRLSSSFLDVDSLGQFTSKGVFFNLPRSDYQDLVRYLFKKKGYPRPEMVASSFEYELQVKGVEDVLDLYEKDNAKVWENEVYVLQKARTNDKLILNTQYEAERRANVFNGHAFRWMKDKLDLDIIAPSNQRSTLWLSIESGPGLGFRPAYLGFYLNDSLISTALVSGLRVVPITIPYLSSYQNTIRVVNKEPGRNFMPWEERYLNFRVAFVSLTERAKTQELLNIFNASNDVIKSSTLPVLTTDSISHDETRDRLYIWNNWGPVEEQNGRIFRWLNNDGELLQLNPTIGDHILDVDLERGPGLGTRDTRLITLLNDIPVDTVQIKGYHRFRIKLGLSIAQSQHENVIRFHLDGSGAPVGDDPRILNLRVFRISYE